jgi:hypothetical protein
MVEKVHKFSSHCPNVYFGIAKEEQPMTFEKKKIHTYKTWFFFFFYLDPSYFQST